MRAAGIAEGAFLPPGWRPGGPDGRRPLPLPHWRRPRAAARRELLVLRDGTPVRLRPLEPTDREALAAAFEQLSPVSRYRRFLSPMPRLSASLLDYLTEIDQVNHFAWVALADEAGGSTGAGVSRFVRLGEPEAADAAVTVLDAYQGRGLGSLLLDALVLRALDHGIVRFEGLVLVENLPSRAMLSRAGARFQPDGGNVLHYVVDLPARAEQLAGSPVEAAVRRYRTTLVGPAAWEASRRPAAPAANSYAVPFPESRRTDRWRSGSTSTRSP